jgi:hypothetical protein
VKLARVLPQNVANLNAYEYFGGIGGDQPTWVSSELNAPLIVEPTVGEMSVMYNQALQSWTLLSLNHNEYAIEIRQAPEPWGPWSEPIEVATGVQFPGLYGSYMNPLYVENGGRTIYFTMSLWGPYDVYLVKATFATASDFGDYNGDGAVNTADYSVWRDTLGSTSNLVADGNGNGTVDAGDYQVWRRNLGQEAVSTLTSAVPEPGAIILAFACIIASVAAIRRSVSR